MRSRITACERLTFKKCGIRNALDGSEDDILYEVTHRVKTTMKMILVAVTTILWVSMTNNLYYGC
jgi:hypothetical protein